MNGYKIGGYVYLAIIVFLIAAKLTGILHTGWALVLMPIWGPIVVAVVAAIIAIALFSGASSRGENPFQ